MRILVTRPEPDASTLAALVIAAGHEVVREPLMQVTFVGDAPLDLTKAQAVLLTSANGARALALATVERAINLYCVGAASARAAQDAGFSSIAHADGDVGDLADMLCQKCVPEAGALVHVAGSVVAGDLSGQLSAAGFEVVRAVLYEAQTATGFSASTKQMLQDGEIDAVMLFSPRTAKTFASLLRNTHLEGACTGLDLLCLSQAVADEVAGLSCRSIKLADRPITEAILALL